MQCSDMLKMFPTEQIFSGIITLNSGSTFLGKKNCFALCVYSTVILKFIKGRIQGMFSYFAPHIKLNGPLLMMPVN